MTLVEEVARRCLFIGGNHGLGVFGKHLGPAILGHL